MLKAPFNREVLLRHDHGLDSPDAFELTSVADGELLVYDTTTGKWINQTLAELDLPTKAGTETIGGAWDFTAAIDFTTTSYTDFAGPLKVTNSVPHYLLVESDAAANQGVWAVLANAEAFSLRVFDDAVSGSVAFMEVQRTSNVVDSIAIRADDVSLRADAASSTFFRGIESGGTPQIGFYSSSVTAAKQTVSGSRGGNAALTSLLTALAATNLITDSSSA